MFTKRSSQAGNAVVIGVIAAVIIAIALVVIFATGSDNSTAPDQTEPDAIESAFDPADYNESSYPSVDNEEELNDLVANPGFSWQQKSRALQSFVDVSKLATEDCYHYDNVFDADTIDNIKSQAESLASSGTSRLGSYLGDLVILINDYDYDQYIQESLALGDSPVAEEDQLIELENQLAEKYDLDGFSSDYHRLLVVYAVVEHQVGDQTRACISAVDIQI